MRIMLAHNRYRQPGGEDNVVCAEADLLRSRGHEVSVYEVHNDSIEGKLNQAFTAIRCTWSRNSGQAFDKWLSDFRPDVVHIHNFFPLLSPAVHHVAHRRGVPVVQTLHNYRLLCPASTLLRDGHICEACTREWYPISAVRHACYRNSRTASAAIANMVVIHRLLGTWSKTVRRFIALSQFARLKFEQSGFPGDRLTVKPNFLAEDPGIGTGSDGYILFIGRLSEEKGIRTLLQAWKHVNSKRQLVIVGDGPLAPVVKEFTTADPSVQWRGYLSRSEVIELMGSACALAFPSIWFEAFPLVLVEAFARGLPVIASNHGSMSEIIQHGRTGLLFSPGSSSEMAASIEWAFDHPTELAGMRQNARAEFESKYTAEINYKMLLDIYEDARRPLPDPRVSTANTEGSGIPPSVATPSLP